MSYRSWILIPCIWSGLPRVGYLADTLSGSGVVMWRTMGIHSDHQAWRRNPSGGRQGAFVNPWRLMVVVATQHTPCLTAPFWCCWVIQSCLTLCDPMDCSPSGFSVHGISQARIVECVAMSFSIYKCTYFFYILFHYRLLQDIEYSSLCYAVGPYWCSMFCIVVYIF